MSSIGTRGEMAMSGLLKHFIRGKRNHSLTQSPQEVCAANEPFVIESMLAVHHMTRGSFLGHLFQTSLDCLR
jgi:hypothetical protein